MLGGAGSARRVARATRSAPALPDPRCGAGRCADGACVVEIERGPIASQIRGDCKVEECTADGRVVSAAAVDPYDDGNQCTLDACDIDEPRHLLLDGVACPASGAGRCHEGACVQCVDTDPSLRCPGGLACDGVWCVPEHCVNGARDDGLRETGLDCGGSCRPCPASERCEAATDCDERRVHERKLHDPDVQRRDRRTAARPASTAASLWCPRCPPGRWLPDRRRTALSGVCWSGICEAPTCTDGVKNGDEAGVDCGGAACAAACPE